MDHLETQWSFALLGTLFLLWAWAMLYGEWKWGGGRLFVGAGVVLCIIGALLIGACLVMVVT